MSAVADILQTEVCHQPKSRAGQVVGRVLPGAAPGGVGESVGLGASRLAIGKHQVDLVSNYGPRARNDPGHPHVTCPDSALES
jgi:hypothetical protein